MDQIMAGSVVWPGQQSIGAAMPHFHFTAIVDTEVAEIEGTCDFPDVDAARAAAREALGRIAANRLSRGECEFISVEILDDHKTPITELRLEFREVSK